MGCFWARNFLPNRQPESGFEGATYQIFYFVIAFQIHAETDFHRERRRQVAEAHRILDKSDAAFYEIKSDLVRLQ